jgi:hypothetical protein
MEEDEQALLEILCDFEECPCQRWTPDWKHRSIHQKKKHLDCLRIMALRGLPPLIYLARHCEGGSIARGLTTRETIDLVDNRNPKRAAQIRKQMLGVNHRTPVSAVKLEM